LIVAIPAPAAGTASAYVQRGLVIFAVLWQVAWTATDILPRSIALGNGVLLISAGTFATWMFLVSTVWGPHTWRRHRNLAIALDLLTLCLGAVALSITVTDPVGWPLGTIATVRAAVFAAIVLLPRQGLLVVGAISVASATALVLGPAGISLGNAILETLYAVALALGAAALAHAVRRLAADVDQAHRRVSDAETGRLVREEVARSTIEHERRLHDQVLNTLAAIARGALTDTASIRARCAEAAASLHALVSEARPTRGESRLSFDAAVGALPTSWRVRTEGDAETFAALPEVVYAGFAAAAAEAIRNAIRHSSGSELSINAERQGQTWSVVIDDNGVGVPADVVPGIGMTRSIRGAMVECGGDAEWATSPQGGTRVTLTWTRPEDGAVQDSSSVLAADAVGVLPAIGPPFLASFLAYGVIVVVAGWSFYPEPKWAALWLALAIATAPFVGAVPRLSRVVGLTGGPDWSWRVVAGIALASSTAFGIIRLEELAVEGAAMPVWVTWSSEVAVSLLFMTVVLGPPWAIAPVLVVWVVAQGGGLSELLQPGSIMLIIAAIFALSMRRRARDYARAIAQLVIERARSEAVSVDARRRRERFELLATYTADLLDQISDGRLDPQDPLVRERCLLEERVARSLVRVDREDGSIESVLHEVVVAGRNRGIYIDADVVGLSSGPGIVDGFEGLRSGVLTLVESELPMGARARVTGGWEEGRAVVRVLAELDGQENLWEWETDDVR
jgi:signal transduction histidine kinase